MKKEVDIRLDYLELEKCKDDKVLWECRSMYDFEFVKLNPLK